MPAKILDPFYNKERKQEYLEFKNMSRIGSNIFSVVKPYEEKAGCDLCEMSEYLIQEIFTHNFGINATENGKIAMAIKKYVIWCKEQGYNINERILAFNPDLSDKYRLMTVESPKHMQRLMKDYFGCSNPKYLNDEIDRLYFWMAYMGLKMQSPLYVLRKDVSIKNKTIKLYGKTYKIPDEAIEDFKEGLKKSELNSTRGNGKNTTNNRLLIGYKGDKFNVNTLSIRMCEKFANPPVYVVKTEFTPMTIYYSGVFYRAYLEEKEGMIPTFGMSSNNPNSKPLGESAIRDLKRNFKEWKKAFSLVGK